jgi:hypothetical protein
LEQVFMKSKALRGAVAVVLFLIAAGCVVLAAVAGVSLWHWVLYAAVGLATATLGAWLVITKRSPDAPSSPSIPISRPPVALGWRYTL